MRTSLYVDGFNLYYGAVKGTPHKWLDLKAAFTAILPDPHRIIAIKYFTAGVSGKLDPRQPIRQQTYWRAVSLPLVEPVGVRRVEKVLKTEEKGSDVSLAVHLLNDAWLDAYDCPVVVSNDSDLAEAMHLVRTHHPGKRLGLIFPRESGHPSRELVKHAHFVKHLGSTVLAASQMPSAIPGTTIRKPAGW